MYIERECVQGGHGFESETRGSQMQESRRVDATNAGFETRVQVRTREEHRRGHELRVASLQEGHRRGHGLRVASIQEGHRRGHGLRVASIQECEGRVIQMSRTRRFALRNCLDAGVDRVSIF